MNVLCKGTVCQRAEIERLREITGGVAGGVAGVAGGVMGPGESVTESPLTIEENGRFNVYPPTQMQMGGEPMAAAMEQGNMAPAPMAAPPMPANLGPAEMDGIASQVNPEVLAMLQGAARSFGDPEQAESFEEMMNMVRGVPATEEERRQELAGVVGPSDAQQTPDSVLALVAAHDVVDGLARDRSGHRWYWPHGTNRHGRSGARGYGRGDHVDGRP